jgi:ElaB/YqjD/DUF883 family membrane-anchored ribosome-binding protein
MDSTHSNEKIAEALKLLEEAAREKKDELRNMVASKYGHLKSVLVDTEHSVAETLVAAQKRAAEALQHAREIGEQKAKAVDEHVHENPWMYIGGAALTGLLLGYILGRNKK